MRFIVNVGVGRILRVEVSPFESLSKNGVMFVSVVNLGRVYAQFEVSVVNCSPNILPFITQTTNMAASQSKDLTFPVVSTLEFGSSNVCTVVLRNSQAEITDQVQVFFNTTDVVKSAGAQSGNSPNSSGTVLPPVNPGDLVCKQCSFFDVGCLIANSCIVSVLKALGSVVLPVAGALILAKVVFLFLVVVFFAL